MNIYIKKFYPQLHFEIEQLLDASYNVWHRLSDEEKISLATFLEEISQESTNVRVYTFVQIRTIEYDIRLYDTAVDDY